MGRGERKMRHGRLAGGGGRVKRYSCGKPKSPHGLPLSKNGEGKCRKKTRSSRRVNYLARRKGVQLGLWRFSNKRGSRRKKGGRVSFREEKGVEPVAQ